MGAALGGDVAALQKAQHFGVLFGALHRPADEEHAGHPGRSAVLFDLVNAGNELGGGGDADPVPLF